MFKIFEYFFITKKYNNTDMTKLKRSAYGTLTSLFGIICNFILCAIKIVCGILSGSISLLADGINNLTDSAASVTSLIGFKLASAPADGKHPFGHERIEYICGMLVSVFILLAGILLGKSSVEKIISKETIDLSKFCLLIGILIFSIIVKVWMGFIYRKVGKKINSTTILASAQDSFNDSFATSAVLISIIIQKFTSVNVDGWLGLLVSVFILVGGVKLVLETVSPLIGEAPNEKEVQKLVDKIKSYDGVLGIHDLMFHSYGPKKSFVTAHVEVDSNINIMKSHETIDNIERDVLNQYGLQLTIHIDPIETNDAFTNDLKDILSTIVNNYENVSFHDFRIVKGEKNVKVLFDIVRPFECKQNPNELKELIASEFINKAKEKENLNYNLIINIDNNYLGTEK